MKKIISFLTLALVMFTQTSSLFAGNLSLTGGTTNLYLTGSTPTISGSTATGELSVNVSATVLPTLNFDISSNVMNFGDLVIGDYTRLDLGYTGTTNALGGMNVTVKSSLLNDGNGNLLGATGQAGTAYKYGKDLVVSDVLGTSFDTTNQMLDSRNSNGMINGNMNLGVKVASDTIAGNYTDTLVFTVTGNF